MTQFNSIFEALRLPEVEPRDVTFLAGAGISFPPPSALPTVRSFTLQLARYCSDGGETVAAVDQALSATYSTSPRFEGLVEAIGQIAGAADSVGAVFDSDEPNPLHRYLARYCESGAAVVTTNFDTCLERALSRQCERLVFSGYDLTSIGPMQSVIVKPHGSNRAKPEDAHGELVVSIRALSKTARGFQAFPLWRRYLGQLFSRRVLIVIGYSGSDDFDITPVLLESKPNQLIWIDYQDGEAPRAAEVDGASVSARRICRELGAVYSRGDLGTIAGTFPAESRPRDKVDAWLRKTYPSAADRQNLLCALLRHYSLHELTIRQTSKPLSAAAALQRGTAFYYRGQYREASSGLERIEDYSPNKLQLCQAAYMLSAAYFYGRDIHAALQASRRNLALAEEIGDIGELQTALNHAAALAYYAGDREDARNLYERVLAYQEHYPSLPAAITAAWGLADLANADDRIADAIEGYTSTMELCRQLGSAPGVAWMNANLGELFLRIGENDAAEQSLKAAEVGFEQTGVAAGVLYSRAYRAQLDYATGEIESAEARLRDCLPLLAEHRESPAIRVIVELAELLAQQTGDDSVRRDLQVVFSSSSTA